jgi:hypothetical protein
MTAGQSWRVDETYVKIRDQWTYLCRAVDRAGKTVDFLLSASAMWLQPKPSSRRRSGALAGAVIGGFSTSRLHDYALWVAVALLVAAFLQIIRTARSQQAGTRVSQ